MTSTSTVSPAAVTTTETSYTPTVTTTLYFDEPADTTTLTSTILTTQYSDEAADTSTVLASSTDVLPVVTVTSTAVQSPSTLTVFNRFTTTAPLPFDTTVTALTVSPVLHFSYRQVWLIASADRHGYAVNDDHDEHRVRHGALHDRERAQRHDLPLRCAWPVAPAVQEGGDRPAQGPL